MNEMIPTTSQDVARPHFVPRVDVIEEADRFIVRADMPGCDPASLDVQYERGALILSGRRAAGDYLRRFNVTDAIDVDKAQADYADGVLTLTLPKPEQARPRSIQVKVS